MWISKQFSNSNLNENPAMQTATVTLNDNGDVEASSTGTERGVQFCAPFGYCYSLPTGEKLLLTHCDAEQTAIGVSMNSKDLKSGEIKISSPFGGFIHLKSNGSVIINGLEIDKDGVIVSDE